MHIIQKVLKIKIIFEFFRVVTIVRAFFITQFHIISWYIILLYLGYLCIFRCFDFDAIFIAAQSEILRHCQKFYDSK